jgi:diguanylate cyclase (GGDEF)-like protein
MSERGSRLSVSARLIILITPPLLLFLLAVAWFFPGRQREHLVELDATNTANAVITQIKTDREYYASVIIPRLTKMKATVQADYHKVPNAFPLPATFLREVTDMVARSRVDYRSSLVSPWPINKANGIQDSFQEEGFKWLRETGNSIYHKREVINGINTMRFLSPDKAVAKSCVECHNAHPDSPKHDFQLNDIMGAIEVSIPIEAPLQEARHDQLLLLTGGIGVGLAILGLVVWGTRRVVTHPVRFLTQQMREIAHGKGELTEAPDIPKATEEAMGEEVRVLWDQFWEMHGAIEASQRERSLELQRQAEALQSMTDRLLDLHRIGQTIQQATSEEEVYRILSHTLQRGLDLRQILILRLNASEDRLEIMWAAPKRDDLVVDSYPVWSEPLSCPVIRSGREYRVGDIRRDLTCQFSLSNTGDGAYWCVPLVIGGRTIGVAHLVSSEPNCWTDDTRQWVEALINVAAPMIGHLQHIEKAKRRALVDELTGTYNRRFLDEVLGKMVLPDERRRRQSLSVLMIDLDHFKAVNDTFGHHVGDIVLKTVASVMHRGLKSSDILVRYGGEEFTVVLPQTDANGATVVAERLRAAVADFSLRRLAPAAPDHITISIGVASYPTHASSVSDLLRIADEALYQAKALGRNRVICAPTSRSAAGTHAKKET